MALEDDDLEEALRRGDELAILRVGRIVTAVLARLRAHDFEQEWDDLRQEVLLALVSPAREPLRDPKAFVAYVASMTRNKFNDRLRRRMRKPEEETSENWEMATERVVADMERAEATADLWREVRALDDDDRSLIEGVYAMGRTWEQMAEHTGIPLGTLKRKLGGALARLRGRMREDDPLSRADATRKKA